MTIPQIYIKLLCSTKSTYCNFILKINILQICDFDNECNPQTYMCKCTWKGKVFIQRSTGKLKCFQNWKCRKLCEGVWADLLRMFCCSLSAFRLKNLSNSSILQDSSLSQNLVHCFTLRTLKHNLHVSLKQEDQYSFSIHCK